MPQVAQTSGSKHPHTPLCTMQADLKLDDATVAKRLPGSLVLSYPSQYAPRHNVHDHLDDSWQFDELVLHDSDVPSVIWRRRRRHFLLLGVLAGGVTLIAFYLVWNGNTREQFQLINQHLTKRSGSGQHTLTIIYVTTAVVAVVCSIILFCLYGDKAAESCLSMGDPCIGCDCGNCNGDCGNCNGDCNC